MKLLYPAIVAVAFAHHGENGEAHFTLNGKNVKDLENRIRNKVFERQNKAVKNYVTSNQYFKASKAKMSAELSDALLDYNMEKEGCQIKTDGFWQDCQQCITQKCTKFMQNTCEMKDDLVMPFTRHSPEIQELLQLLESAYGMSPSFEFDLDLNTNPNQGLKLNIGGSIREKRYAKAKKSNRSKRQADDDCGHVEVTCDSGDCSQFDFQPFQQVVCDRDIPDLPENMPYFGMTETPEWKLTGTGTHNFNLNSEDLLDGRTKVSLDLTPVLGSRVENVDRQIPEKIPVYDNQEEEVEFDSNSDNYDNEYEGYYDDDYVSPSDDDYDEADERYFNDEEVLPAYDDANSDRREQGSYEDDEIVDSHLQKYCDSIGGCDNYILRKKRGQRSKRSNYLDENSKCEMIMAEPLRCRQLGLNCEACETKISEVCPEYHQIRQSFADRLNNAGEFFESMSTYKTQQEEVLDWYGALTKDGEASIFIQRAYYDPNTDMVSLAIGVGSGDLAYETIATGKLPLSIDFEEFADAVADEVIDAGEAKQFM